MTFSFKRGFVFCYKISRVGDVILDIGSALVWYYNCEHKKTEVTRTENKIYVCVLLEWKPHLFYNGLKFRRQSYVLSNFLFINAQGKILYILNHAYKLDLLLFLKRVIKNGEGVVKCTLEGCTEKM